MPIDPNHKTLKRRSGELKAAAEACGDTDAKALLFFYAAECMLKASYLQKFSLQTTATENAAALSARSYSHRLDLIITALKAPAIDCPARPNTLKLRGGSQLDVGQLHEAWRYGEKIEAHAEAIEWLVKILAYAEARV